jgi:hypothetical protein
MASFMNFPIGKIKKEETIISSFLIIDKFTGLSHQVHFTVSIIEEFICVVAFSGVFL